MPEGLEYSERSECLEAKERQGLIVSGFSKKTDGEEVVPGLHVVGVSGVFSCVLYQGILLLCRFCQWGQRLDDVTVRLSLDNFNST
jgi:hypothetical protein